MNFTNIKTMLKTLYQDKSAFESPEDFLDFENTRINTNVNRINSCNILITLTSVYLSLYDIFRANIFNPKSAYNISLFLSHSSLLIVNGCWFIYFYLFKRRLSLTQNKIIYWIFTHIFIYESILGSFFNPSYNFKSSIYLLAMFAIISLLYIPPVIWSITSAISSLILLEILYKVNTSINQFRMYFSEIVFIFCFGCLLSSIIYKFYRDDYIINKKLLSKNKALSEMEINKSNFFANVSHELKTPLNIIYSSEQMLEIALKNNPTSQETLTKYLNLIKQNTNRTTKLIQNLIDITKIDSSCFTFRPVNIDIIKVVEDITLSAVDYIESHNIDIIFDTNIEENIISCDPDMIERIILNLLSNAVKFTDAGGNILVNINYTEETTFISVSDTGIGIPESMQLNIFNRYAQVEHTRSNRKEGSGIGLSLVKSLVEIHQGNITLESKVGVGSTFTFSLPNVINDSLETITNNTCMYNNEDKIKIEFSDIK